MKPPKPIAIGCTLLLLTAGVLCVVAAPRARRAAHRRELGRGAQTLVEMFWPEDDLYADLATASGSLEGQPLCLKQTVTLNYAGPYSIDLRTANSPPNPLPKGASYPSVEVSITTARGIELATGDVGFRSPFWGRHQGFILFWFDAPCPVPIDEPLNVSVVVRQVPPSFSALYGTNAVLVLKRLSSE